jgi:hypothetical protein
MTPHDLAPRFTWRLGLAVFAASAVALIFAVLGELSAGGSIHPFADLLAALGLIR